MLWLAIGRTEATWGGPALLVDFASPGRLAARMDRLVVPGPRREVRAGREADLTDELTGGPGPDQDREAFELAFAAHEEDVARVCRRILGNLEDARDAPQEVFLRARRAFSSYDPERPFRPWLLAIAGNYCIDKLRHHSLERRIFTDLDSADVAPSDAGPSPLGRMVVLEERRQIGLAIAKLPLKYRLPLVLRYFSDLDYEAIAVALGVSRNQVGTLLFRAKQRLRQAVAEATPRSARRPTREEGR